MVKESPWRVIQDLAGEPAENMAKDEGLARQVFESGLPPTLRVYGWKKPAISLGRRQQAGDLPSDLLREKLPLVRRPTGGGAVVHDVEEVTYCLAASRSDIPAGVSLREISGLIHRWFRDFLCGKNVVGWNELSVVEQGLHRAAPLCFSAPTQGDLIYRGRKAAGAALRVWREGILIQGSIQGLPVKRSQWIELFALLTERGFK